MKAYKVVKKTCSLLTALGSVALLAGVVSDIQSQSVSFMNDSEIEFARRLDAPSHRVVASDEAIRPAAQYVPFNIQNTAKINGQWSLVRITNSRSEDIFLKDSENLVNAELELVQTSFVNVEVNREDLLELANGDFRISLLKEEGRVMTLALFQVKEDGDFNILELRKEIKVEQVVAKRRVELVQNNTAVAQEEIVEEVITNDSSELVLERALDQKVSQSALVGNQIDGTLSVSDGAIEGLFVTLHQGTSAEKRIEVISSEIKDGGMFEYESEGSSVTGVISQTTNGGYRVRFATGKNAANVLLNFVTYEELDRLEEEKLEQEYNNVETQELAEEVEEIQTDVENQRRDVANDEEVELDADEVAQKVQESGFNFSNNVQRSIASQK